MLAGARRTQAEGVAPRRAAGKVRSIKRYAWPHKTHDGLLHSRVFPGLRLPVTSLLAGNAARVLTALSGVEAHEPNVKSED